jgi:hypothetical protein
MPVGDGVVKTYAVPVYDRRGGERNVRILRETTFAR